MCRNSKNQNIRNDSSNIRFAPDRWDRQPSANYRGVHRSDFNDMHNYTLSILRCPYDFSELISACLSKGEPDYLTCPNCGRRYPLIQGIPVLFDLSVSSIDDVKQVEFYEDLYTRQNQGETETRDTGRDCSETLINNTWRRIRDFYARSKSVNEVFHCFEDQFSSKGGETVLEVGCGLGTPGTELCLENRDHIDYLGLDFALKPLLSLDKKFSNYGATRFKLVNSSILDDCLAHESFDIIFGRGILHHFDRVHKPDLAKRIYSLLKTDGKAFFLEPLNTNPMMKVLRSISRPFRPNLAWEHPFSAKELKNFISFFDSHEVHYFIGMSIFSLMFAFQKDLFRIADLTFRHIDKTLSGSPAYQRFFTKMVIVVYKK